MQIHRPTNLFALQLNVFAFAAFDRLFSDLVRARIGRDFPVVVQDEIVIEHVKGWGVGLMLMASCKSTGLFHRRGDRDRMVVVFFDVQDLFAVIVVVPRRDDLIRAHEL